VYTCQLAFADPVQCRVQLGDTVYTLEDACREIQRLSGHVKALQIANEGFKATEKSETDVYHMALQDMSAQLQVAAAERAACMTKMVQLQECAPLPRDRSGAQKSVVLRARVQIVFDTWPCFMAAYIIVHSRRSSCHAAK
jgi:hypothetical protein